MINAVEVAYSGRQLLSIEPGEASQRWKSITSAIPQLIPGVASCNASGTCDRAVCFVLLSSPKEPVIRSSNGGHSTQILNCANHRAHARLRQVGLAGSGGTAPRGAHVSMHTCDARYRRQHVHEEVGSGCIYGEVLSASRFSSNRLA